MATWWRSVSNHPTTTSIEPFCITNRFWYTLRALLAAGNARNLDKLESLDGSTVAIPSTLANHWGNVLLHLDLTQWVQVMEWDGAAFVPTRIAPLSQAANLLDTCELVELTQTPYAQRIRTIGAHLANTTIGLTIDGRAGRKYPVEPLLCLDKPGERVDILDLAKKGGNPADHLTTLEVRLGWDARKGAGEPFDLDASVVPVGANGKCVKRDLFCWYNNKIVKRDGVTLMEHLLGDSQDGSDEGREPGGPDEAIRINVEHMPADVVSLDVIVTIHKAIERNQSFARVNNAWIALADPGTGVELLRYDLSERAGTDWNAMLFAKIYRYGDTWKFKSDGDEGYTGELRHFTTEYAI